MNPDDRKHFPFLGALCLLAVALSVGCGRKQSALPSRQLSPALVDSFHVGVASLDVEENERASKSFSQLSQELADEPAVWANLGIVRLRLGDLPAAAQALETAAKLAPGNTQISVAQAVVEERQGQFAKAIERLRSIRNPDATVLYQLVELLGRTGNADAHREQLAVYDQLLQLDPRNIVVIFGKARLLARGQNQAMLAETLKLLDEIRTTWTDEASQQLDSAKTAVGEGNLRAAATHLTFLQNLNLATPQYKEALAKLGAQAGSVGEPIREFLRYPQPPVLISPPDTGLQFESAADADFTAPPELYLAVPKGTNTLSAILVMDKGTFRWNDESHNFRNTPTPGTAFVCADLNGDFTQELVWLTDKGLDIRLQDNQGSLTSYAPTDEIRPIFQLPGHGVWPLDFEADGDLDLLFSPSGGPPRLLRNNGDIGTGTGFIALELAGFPEVQDACWADFDADGDGDLALLDLSGRVLVSWNDRAGAFRMPTAISPLHAHAITFGDLFASGHFGLTLLETNGGIISLLFEAVPQKWSERRLGQWQESAKQGKATSRPQIHLADLDNNGAVDVIASLGGESAIWLNHGGGKLERLTNAPKMAVSSVVDIDGDGLLDLVGPTANGAATARTKGSKGYHWQAIHTRALANQADGRINSFGIGGKIELRAGQLLSVMPITSPSTHFGLGDHSRAGIARIVWPNGAAQVEFELQANQRVTAMQRLKGSCPWVFARAGDKFNFIKDFIWRSPLGMRINSQDTAGVDQTEDWILIPGDLLGPHDGHYEIRITAELWETHFFDHVSLIAVDHPAAFEVFVDERFVPTRQPTLAVIAAEPPRALLRAQDESGHDVLTALERRDGNYVDDFPLGRFQGIAADHWIEFELPVDAPSNRPIVLIGEGWIYPTDSSLNVAISQGEHPRPRGLVLEVKDPQFGWRALDGELGFPAGKNKTVVLPLPMDLISSGLRTFRLRTNLEIYWDRLAWAVALPEAQMKTVNLAPQTAELRHRGFSRLSPPDRRRPDIPIYEELSGIGPRWRDLEGFYTRYGDVRELLARIDDRYVIMNAGDEFVFRFAVPSSPPDGWKRDFVLVGDGWVKDGDYNTANSPTVHPLPSHRSRNYGGPPAPITADPVFRQNISDWEQFHTRYADSSHFERGLIKRRTHPNLSKEFP